MNQEIFEKLDELEREIDSGAFLKEVSSVTEWGGADVIIRSRLDDSTKKWLGEQPLAISLQESEPRRRAVITEFSKELSSLFYKLKDIFSGEIDYVSKYNFHGLLAQAAINYLGENKEKPKCDQLLKSVLNRARSFYNK